MRNSPAKNAIARLRAAKAIEAPKADIRTLTRRRDSYGPPIPLTLEEVARQARVDPLPLRGPEGGYYGAERNPAVLARQFQVFSAAFGAADRTGMPPWVLKVGLVIMTLVLGGAGYFIAPLALGIEGEIIKGAGNDWHAHVDFAGLAAGVLVGAGAGWFLLTRTGAGTSEGNANDFFTVYAPARITQVEWLDRLGTVVSQDASGARRHPIRRMRTYLQRAAFADRQEVFVPPQEAEGKKKRNNNSQERFRRGEIRIETTQDLRTIRTPHDLYDSTPLSGRWRGVNALRWFVALKYPLETGMVALLYHTGDDLKSALRKFFVSTYGFWVLVVCAIAGFFLLFITIDYQQTKAEAEQQVPDRTPVERRVTPEVTR